MYSVGDLIVYGNTGVCEVQKITARVCPGTDEERMYYVLVPRFRKGTIYAPVNNTSVFMRPVMSAKEVNGLIDQIPSVKVETHHFQSNQQRMEYYRELLHSHNSMDLIELIMSAYDKRLRLQESSRTIGEIDASCMKQAEEMLNGEFSVALGIPYEEVPDYIGDRVEKVTRKRSRWRLQRA